LIPFPKCFKIATIKFGNEMGTATKTALKSKRKVEPIPKCFKNENEAAKFWETHSVADY